MSQLFMESLFLIKVSFPDHHEQDFQATPQDPEPDADPGSMVGALLDQDMHGEHVSLAQVKVQTDWK